jgi:hypothetical protein
MQEVASLLLTTFGVVICQLLIRAWVFTCRSCEYCNTEGTELHIKIMYVRNIRFFLGNKELAHSDPHLGLADTITITFEYQKRDECDESIKQQRTRYPLMCPSRQWAALIQCWWGYPTTTRDTQMDTVEAHGKPVLISSKILLAKL